MSRISSLAYEFVEYIPEVLKDGVIYISVDYATASHKCCCGCGGLVVTPISPNDWKLIYDGRSISLYPSIGNWGFDCRSHYWIKNNSIEWAKWQSDKEICAGRRKDRRKKRKVYKKKKAGFFSKWSN